MTQKLRLITTVMFCASILGCGTFGGSYKVQVPAYKEETLPNGLRLISVKDQTLPLVGFTILLAPGASADPMGRAGLTFTTVELLEKGTTSKSADQIADAFGAYGTSFRSTVTHDFVLLTTDTLSQHQSEVFSLFREVALEPKFDPKELGLLKPRMIALIQNSYDDPNVFADRALTKQVMGSHAYGRPVSGTERDVAGLQLQDVKEHYANYVRPENTTLIVTGDYSKELLNQIRSKMGSWKAPEVSNVKALVSAKPPADQRQLILVDRKDLQQSQIRLGHVGIKRNDPDYWAAQVANVILGGNFSSRLMREIRVKRGLTYSVRSSFSAGVSEGPFEVSTFTRHDKVGETVSVTLDVLKEFQKKGVTEQEVESGKSYLKGHLIRSFEKPEDIVRAIARARLYGLPESEVINVVEHLSKVSVKDVNRVIRDHFRPDSLRVMIYSSQEAVIEQLRPIGALEVRPYKEFL